jgi:hypothetical protein
VTNIFSFSFIGGLNLSKVSVKGVAAALEKNSAENIESKGIKAHFRFVLYLTLSGSFYN